jgi:uncharacterized protein YcfJ
MKYITMILLVFLAGCSTVSYTPTVDTFGDNRAAYIEADMADCKQLALQASGPVKNTVIDTIVGGFLGAAGGAATGAFLGNPALGASIGAAAGGFGGATRGGFDADSRFRNAYNQCMTGRGHNVIR